MLDDASAERPKGLVKAYLSRREVIHSDFELSYQCNCEKGLQVEEKKNPIKINAVSDEYFGNFDCYLLFLHFYLCFSFLWTMSIMWKNEHEEAEVDLDYN